MIFGKGINDFEKPISCKGVKMREYILWKSMLERCYSSHNAIKNNSYCKVSVQEQLLSFSNFHSFVRGLQGFDQDGWQMDKDIIGSGLSYDVNSIVFVPREINLFFAVDIFMVREKPIGAKLDKKRGKVFSSMKRDGKTIFIGYFETELDAHKAYLRNKANYGKVLASRYQECLDSRVLKELNNCEDWFKSKGLCH